MEIGFGLQLVTARWGRPDVLICVTPPLLAAAMSVIRARLTWRGPAVGVLVQDMYRRGITETQVSSGVSARAIGEIESMTLKLCDGVSVIHSVFADDLNMDYGIDRQRIRVIRNWTRVDSPDAAASAAFRRARGWSDDELIVLHAGNMGYKQGLENVVEAAELARATNRRVRFVLLGDGNQREPLQQMAADLKALEFLPPVSEAEFPAALGAADVLLVNERSGVANMSVPSKLTSYFNSGKPILAATDAEGATATELNLSSAGVCVPPGRPDLLLDKAMALGADPALADRLGQAGKTYSRRLLTEEAALNAYEQWVVELADLHRT